MKTQFTMNRLILATALTAAALIGASCGSKQATVQAVRPIAVKPMAVTTAVAIDARSAGQFRRDRNLHRR